MKKQITKFVILMFILAIVPINITNAQDLSDRLSGKILLQVEGVGQAWYIDPGTKERAFLGRPADAFRIMRELGLGISEQDYNSFNGYAPSKLSGKILLRVEAKGEAYYVFPDDLKMHYLGRPDDAFDVMRDKGLGITDKDLNEVPIFQKYKEKLETLEKKVEELAEKIAELEGGTAQEDPDESDDTATPPTTPAPPTDTSTYLIDDFEEGTQNWALSDETAWSTIVEDGNTVLRGAIEGAGDIWAVLQGKEWDNYGLKFKFKRIKGSLIAEFRRKNGRYSVYMPQGRIDLEKHGANEIDESVNFDFDQNWHTVEIRGYNNILNVYMDNELVIKYKDTESPMLSGGVAIFVGDDKTDSEYLIDDVEIKVITEEDIIYPSTSASPASTSDAYFSQDFDKGESWTLDPGTYDPRWAVVFPGDGTNGMLTKVDDADYAFTSFGEQTWTDYRLKLKVKFEEGFVEINTRMSAEDGNYALSIFGNQLILDKDVKPRVRFEAKDYSFDPDRFYDIKLELKGDNIKIYVDDELQIDYVDTGSPVLAGHVGLYISDKSYIDYVLVEGL
jgi:hypothetical protein